MTFFGKWAHLPRLLVPWLFFFESQNFILPRGIFTKSTKPFRPERPGDLALPSFDPRGPILLDPCAIHPLAPSRDLTPAQASSALKAKEASKRSKYHDLCAREAYFFSPMVFHLWGGLGLASGALIKRIIRHRG